MKIIDLAAELKQDTWTFMKIMPNFLKELALAIFGLFYPLRTKK